MLSPVSHLTLMSLSHTHTDVSAEPLIRLNNRLGFFFSFLFIKSAVADDGGGEGSKVKSRIFESGAINGSCSGRIVLFFGFGILLSASLYRLFPSVRHLFCTLTAGACTFVLLCNCLASACPRRPSLIYLLLSGKYNYLFSFHTVNHLTERSQFFSRFFSHLKWWTWCLEMEVVVPYLPSSPYGASPLPPGPAGAPGRLSPSDCGTART